MTPCTYVHVQHTLNFSQSAIFSFIIFFARPNTHHKKPRFLYSSFFYYYYFYIMYVNYSTTTTAAICDQQKKITHTQHTHIASTVCVNSTALHTSEHTHRHNSTHSHTPIPLVLQHCDDAFFSTCRYCSPSCLLYDYTILVSWLLVFFLSSYTELITF